MAVALVVIALIRSTRGHRIVLALSVVTALVFPVAFTLATQPSIGNIWQGRYGLPYAVGALLLAGYLVSLVRPRGVLPWRLTIPAVGSYGTALVACWVKVRDVELADNSASIQDASWHEPSFAALALLAMAAAGLFVAALSSGSPRVSSSSERSSVKHMA
jgi:hypothetical protein